MSTGVRRPWVQAGRAAVGGRGLGERPWAAVGIRHIASGGYSSSSFLTTRPWQCGWGLAQGRCRHLPWIAGARLFMSGAAAPESWVFMGVYFAQTTLRHEALTIFNNLPLSHQLLQFLS